MAGLLFSTSLAILVTEVFYTRLFSVLFWHNTAFAILSFALLGIGVSGLAVYLLPGVFTRERAHGQMGWLTPVFALSLLASHVLILVLARLPTGPGQPFWISLGSLTLVIVAALLPFLLGGLILSVAFTHFTDQISRLYFWDLAGAAVGAALALPAISVLNGPPLVPVLGAAVCVVGTACAFAARQRGAAAASALVGLLLAGAPWALGDAMRVTFSKGRPEAHVHLERWDPVARVTVEGDLWFKLDGAVVTPILAFDGDVGKVGYLRHNVLQLAYRLRRYPSILIIGPGGGSDALAALAFGNTAITAVEVNRSIVALMRRGALREYSGRLYERPEIRLRIADGRGFVAALPERVDLIQATFVDTYAAAATGSQTLSENYLYTVEAMHDFLGHLAPDGILSMSRWGGVTNGPYETYRLVAMAAQALRARGARDPGAHVVVVLGPTADDLVLGAGYQHRSGDMDSMATTLVKNTPFLDSEIEALERISRESRFRPLWLGGRGEPDPVLAEVFRREDAARFHAEYYERHGMDISPVSDDRPFFFDMVRPQDFPRLKDRFPWRTDVTYAVKYIGVAVLYQVLGAMAGLVGSLLGVPLLFRLGALRQLSGTLPVLGYFVCLGLGYIGIEIGLIQRFSLFLGHPVYALVVVLGAMLLISGAGSLQTQRIAAGAAPAALRRVGGLLLVLGVYAPVLPWVVRELMGQPLPLKVAITVALIAPPAYLMGMLFPLGLKAAARTGASLVPWLWGANSGCSVLGAVLSLFLAMSWGYGVAWWCFAAIYLGAGLCLLRMGVRS